jgi:hypothetical protein
MHSYKSPEDPDANLSIGCRRFLSNSESPIFSCSSRIRSEVEEFVGLDNEGCIPQGRESCKEKVIHCVFILQSYNSGCKYLL